MARRYGVKCVVPKPYQALHAKGLLRGSDVRLCIAVGFPQGLNLPEVKRREAELALPHGASARVIRWTSSKDCAENWHSRAVRSLAGPGIDPNLIGYHIRMDCKRDPEETARDLRPREEDGPEGSTIRALARPGHEARHM